MNKQRLITEGKKVPAKIDTLMRDPVVCSKILAAWEALQKVSVAVIFDLPLYCKKHNLDAAATVLAANQLLTTFEVFKDQALDNRVNAKGNQTDEETTSS